MATQASSDQFGACARVQQAWIGRPRPRRLALLLAQALWLLGSSPGQADVQVLGPYWLVTPTPQALGPGNVSMPEAWLAVGAGAPGSFAATAGAQLNLGGLALAAANGTATALLDGAGTRLTLGFDSHQSRLQVGHFGDASLTVSGGATIDGRVNAANCLLGGPYGCNSIIAATAGSKGLLTITGPGSSLGLAGHLDVGLIYADTNYGIPGGSSHGRVEVLNGGLLSNDSVTLGDSNAGPATTTASRSFASALLAGADSRWQVTGSSYDSGAAVFDMAHGKSSQAAMEIREGGQLSIVAPAGRYYALNVGSGGDASLLVTGAGSRLQVQGDVSQGNVRIGDQGSKASLSILNGARFDTTTRWVDVGLNGGSGLLTLSDAGSLATFAPSSQLTVGNAGTGRLEVLASAQLNAGQLNVGMQMGTGTVLLDGIGSRIDLTAIGTHRLNLGQWGDGSMTVSGGAVLDASGGAADCVGQWCGSFVGQGAGSTAALLVTGKGSRASFVQSLNIGQIDVNRPPLDPWTFGSPGANTHAGVAVVNGGMLSTDELNSGGWLMPSATGTERSFSGLTVSGQDSLLNVHGSALAGVDARVSVSNNSHAKADWQILQGGRMQVIAPSGREAALDLGAGGDAQLLLSDGGSSLAIEGQRSRLVIGNLRGAASSVARLTVKDGATLTQSGVTDSYLNIAEAGSANLSILSGGKVSGARQVTVGLLNGVSGSLWVDGAGSSLSLLDADANLTLAARGQGAMTISGGGLVQTGRLEMGRAPDAMATGLLTGVGSRLELSASNRDRLYLGNASLTVADGAVLDGRQNAAACDGGVWCATLIGANAGANAKFIVTGAGSRASFLGSFQVGIGNLATPAVEGWLEGTPGGITTASVQVLGGGLLQTDHVSAGLGTPSASATGAEAVMVALAVRGPGSLWQISGGDTSAFFQTHVWYAKNSFVTVDIRDGGKMQLLGPTGLGAYMDLSGSTGSTVFKVSGANSALEFVSDSGAYLGLGGGNGSAQMSFSAGASLSGVDQLMMGLRGGVGSLSLDGAGTRADLAGDSYVLVGWRDGIGSLNVLNGAKFGNPGGGSAQLSVGQGSSNGGVFRGTGTVRVAGAGSELNLQVNSRVPGGGIDEAWNPIASFGDRGDGNLQISDGARFVLQGNAVSTLVDPRPTTLYLGGREGHQGGTASAVLRGAGSLLKVAGSNASVEIGTGAAGVGSLQVLNQARLESGRLNLGNAGGSGTLRVDNAQIQLSESLSVGHSGFGLAKLSAGASVDLGTGSVYIGRQGGAQGLLSLEGGAKLQAAYIGVGSTASGDGGVGRLIVNDSTVTAGLIEVGSQGYVGGNGTLVGQILNRGVINPGNSPGTLVLDGSFINAVGGRLVLEVQSDGHGGFNTDHLIFTAGSAIDLSGLQLSFRFLGGTDPNAFLASGQFDIDNFFQIRAANGSSSDLKHELFSQTKFSASAEGYRFNSFAFSADGGAVFSAAAVPEPQSWAMLLAGLACFAYLQRRRPPQG